MLLQNFWVLGQYLELNRLSNKNMKHGILELFVVENGWKS